MLHNNHVSRRGTLRKALVAPVVLALVLLISCSKNPGNLASDRTLDQAKLAKERLDMKVRKLLPESVLRNLKKRAAAAAAAGMSDMDYKKLMERKMLETEKQMRDGTLKPAE